jgi:hypothetical protein
MAYDAEASFYRSNQVFDAEKLVAEKFRATEQEKRPGNKIPDLRHFGLGWA